MAMDNKKCKMAMHNANWTCCNCPAIDLMGKVDFGVCGQSKEVFSQDKGEYSEAYIVGECKRRPELGLFDPTSVTFEECPEWQPTTLGYVLKDMPGEG